MEIRIDTEKKTVSVVSDHVCTLEELEFLGSAYEIILQEMRLEFEYLMGRGEVELDTRLNIFESGRKLKRIPGDK